MPNSVPLFALGRLYSTPGAIIALEESSDDCSEFLNRHVTGDWSEMVNADQKENQRAIEDGSRIISAHRLSSGQKIWVITESDRSATTVLLADEY